MDCEHQGQDHQEEKRSFSVDFPGTVGTISETAFSHEESVSNRFVSFCKSVSPHHPAKPGVLLYVKAKLID